MKKVLTVNHAKNASETIRRLRRFTQIFNRESTIRSVRAKRGNLNPQSEIRNGRPPPPPGRSLTCHLSRLTYHLRPSRFSLITSLPQRTQRQRSNSRKRYRTPLVSLRPGFLLSFPVGRCRIWEVGTNGQNAIIQHWHFTPPRTVSLPSNSVLCGGCLFRRASDQCQNRRRDVLPCSLSRHAHIAPWRWFCNTEVSFSAGAVPQ